MNDVYGTTTRGYDDNGSLTSESSPSGTTAYRYDVMGRMAGIDTDNDGNDDTTYAYNARGERVSQTDVATSTTTVYLLDPMNPTGYSKQLEELVNGTLTRSFTMGLMVHGQWDSADGVATLLHDGHGSTRLLMDPATDLILEAYTYTAFGDALGFTADTAGTQWLFANDGVYDPASKLTYHLERWRSGHVFTQTDPYAGNFNDPLSLHKRIYAHQNPVMGMDPTGLVTLKEIQFSASLMVSKVAARNAQVFAVGGAAIGRYFNAIGLHTQRLAQHVFSLFPRLSVAVRQPISNRWIDYIVRHGNRIAQIEVKYSIPRRHGAAFNRLIGQINAMNTHRGQTVVFSLRQPTMASLNRLHQAIGTTAFNQVQFAHGVKGLYQFIKLYFGF